MAQGRSVAILLASYNGARFIGEQLRSIAAQTHKDWALWVSDDGSTDGTRAIVEHFAEAHPGQVHLVDGPRRGTSAANFLSLCARPEIDADYFAFCDQDDVWMPDHLAVRLAQLAEGAALVGGRTAYVGEDGAPLGTSSHFRKSPSFENALVQSLAGGNTMVFDRRLRDLLALTPKKRLPAVHDWWAYQIATGAGLPVIYDPEPCLHYRQHGQNLIGSNTGFKAKMARIRGLFTGRFAGWNDENTVALEAMRPHLTPEACATFDRFVAARAARGVKALGAVRAAGLVRQSRIGTVSLYLAAALGRI
ncbi:glycosyltransferase family 2 protein [Celeribacter arenosi]|uniref:Glycosyltransferase family 2 protein n=1 Tax=Celeribacter arenosi TaxID=792649 RepID=A0ABP7JZ53_9RHOB